MTKLTEKNTKKEILLGYEEALEKIKELKENMLNPSKEASDKKDSVIVATAHKTAEQNIKELIGALESKVSVALSNVINGITIKSEEYRNLEEAISLKKDELKELFEIETNAYSLVALINAQNDSKTKFSEEQTKRVEALENTLSNLREMIKTEEENFKAKIKAEAAEIKNTRAREEEEYVYNRDRNRKKEQDTFNDEMEEKKKELDLREIKVIEAEEEVETKKDYIEKLEAKVDSIPEQIEEAVSKAVADAKKTSDTSHGFETRYLKKDHESTVQLLEAKLQTAESTIVDQKDTIADLTSKLNAAYAEIKDVAIKTVDSTRATDMLSRLERTMSDKNQK